MHVEFRTILQSGPCQSTCGGDLRAERNSDSVPVTNGRQRLHAGLSLPSLSLLLLLMSLFLSGPTEVERPAAPHSVQVRHGEPRQGQPLFMCGSWLEPRVHCSFLTLESTVTEASPHM